MRRGQSIIRLSLGRQGVLSLFLLAAIAVQPLNLSGFCTACKVGSAAPHDDCCPKPGSGVTPASASQTSCCLTLCAPNRDPNSLVTSRGASGGADLRPMRGHAVAPVLNVSFNRKNSRFFSQDISVPISPLHQSSLLRI